MALPNIFSKEVTEQVIARIERLSSDTQPQWGKMSVSQMLAHCCVTYEMAYSPEKFSKPGFFMRWMLGRFVKPVVVGEAPYKHNSRTAPAFIITDQREFDREKERLTAFMRRTQELGAQHFDGKASHSFGNLSVTEWNNMFYKHLDHHLTQFGV